MRFRLLLIVPLLASVGCHWRQQPAPEPPATDTSDSLPPDPSRPYVPRANCPLPPLPDNAATDSGFDVAAADQARATAAEALYRAAFTANNYDEALACAQAFSRLAPDNPRGPLDRALSLDALDQVTAAQFAFERALAMDADNTEVLEPFARFLIRTGDTDAIETAVMYARRGREHTELAATQAVFAAVEARALNELGRSEEALQASESSLALDSDKDEAAVERGVALFEYLHFDEAGKTLTELHAKVPQSARVDFFLGLFDERQGRGADADALFAAAAKIDPDTYPAPMNVSPAEFQKIVDLEVKKLTPALRKDLATTSFSWQDIPSLEDLQAGDPVLSPEIVGVFRPGDKGRPDAILLYRRNLLRVAHTDEDLRSEVRETLLHELGHLHGEDDDELRDEGL